MTAEKLSTVDALAQASFLLQNTLEARAAQCDASLVQTRLLGVLRDREPTINELAKLLGLDKSSTSGLVDRAEHRGLVRRLRSELDRRSVQVVLTDQGRETVGTVAALFAADVDRLLAPLTASQREQLTGMLGEILEARAAGEGVDF